MKTFPVPPIYSAYICNRDWHRNTLIIYAKKKIETICIFISQVSETFKIEGSVRFCLDLKSWFDLMGRNMDVIYRVYI